MSAFAHALIVDDLASSRDWLAHALRLAFPGIAISAAATLAEGLEHVASAPPLALIDLALPDGSGLRLIERLHAVGSLCVVASVFDDDSYLFPALRAGAQGYVLKDQSPESLAAMLIGIAYGRPPLSPSIARRLLRHFQPREALPAGEVLTERETDVLRLVAKGLTVAEVADLLVLSRHTVAGYLKDIYRKLRIGTRAEAVLEATRRGLVGH